MKNKVLVTINWQVFEQIAKSKAIYRYKYYNYLVMYFKLSNIFVSLQVLINKI